VLLYSIRNSAVRRSFCSIFWTACPWKCGRVWCCWSSSSPLPWSVGDSSFWGVQHHVPWRRSSCTFGDGGATTG